MWSSLLLLHAPMYITVGRPFQSPSSLMRVRKQTLIYFFAALRYFFDELNRNSPTMVIIALTVFNDNFFVDLVNIT
jgi:hypothetical protein